MTEREEKLLVRLEDLVEAVDNFYFNVPTDRDKLKILAAGAWLEDAWWQAKTICILTKLRENLV